MTETSENAIFSDYCNICCRSDQQLKNISEDNDLKETILCLTGHKDAFIGSDIYLCFACCEFLEHCYKFKQMCLINLVIVRQIYFEISKLELQENEPAAKLLKDALHARMIKNIDNIKHNYSVTLSKINDENKIEKNSTSYPKSNVIDVDVVSKLKDHVSIIVPKRLGNTVEDSNIKSVDNVEQNFSDNLPKKSSKDKTEAKPIIKTENILNNDVLRKLGVDVSLVIQRRDENVENSEANDVENIVCDINPEYKLGESNELYESDEDENVKTYDMNVENEVELIYVSDASDDKMNIKQEDFGYKSEPEAAKYEEDQFHFLSEMIPVKPRFPNKGNIACKWPSCGKVFQNVSDLKFHHLIHKESKNRPFACNWPGCNWKFVRKDHLNRHLRKHTAEKPYECTHCGRTFSRSDHMATHMKSVHTFLGNGDENCIQPV